MGTTIIPEETLLHRVTGPQLGVFHRRQANEIGISDRCIDRGVQLGRWIRVHRSVFILAGAPLTWEARLVAACFWAGPVAAASHESAALLWDAPGFKERLVVVTTTRSVRKQGMKIHNRARLAPTDITRVGAVPVTCVERTIVDVAATRSEAILEATLDDFLFRRLTTIEKLNNYREAMQGLAGTARLAELFDERGHVPPLQTILETFTARVVRRFSLPEPQRQLPIYDGTRRTKTVDLAYGRYQVAIEPDGGRWHSPKRKREEDSRVRNRLQAMGWIVLVVTWEAINKRPREVAETVLAALRSRGYTGSLYESRR
jgi:very-short-patch-repair endonuclease